MNDAKIQKKLEQMDTPDMHETLLRGQWKNYARFAYEHYLQEGRGAILIDLKRASFKGKQLQLPSHYVADASDKLAKLGGWPSPEIAAVVRDYDPELDLIFLVWRLDDEIIYYVATDDFTPKQAYEARR
ncbi:MAG: hypothetical protein AB1757_25725 [Acidobacteriota bacterium]